MHPQLNLDQPSEISHGLQINPDMSHFGGDQPSLNPNSYVDNLAYVDSLNKEDKYLNRAK